MIIEKVFEAKKQKQRVFPCRSNRASLLGFPCERCLVYHRTSWEKMALPPVEKEFLFEGGRNIEELALQELKEAGYKIFQQGRDFELKEQEITGHIDCLISLDGENYPCEIKGISPYDFNKINTIEDMLNSEKPYIRAYPAQLQLYLFMAAVNKLTSQEQPQGLFYIKNKLTFLPKEIWIKLDFEYVEELLKKAERINQHVKNNTLPERIDDVSVCLECPFKHICLPDIKRAEGIELIEDLEIEQMIKRWFELKNIVNEYNELDEKIRKYCEGKNRKIIGNFLITGKMIKKTIPAQEEKVIQYWQKKIIKLDENEF